MARPSAWACSKHLAKAGGVLGLTSNFGVRTLSSRSASPHEQAPTSPAPSSRRRRGPGGHGRSPAGHRRDARLGGVKNGRCWFTTAAAAMEAGGTIDDRTAELRRLGPGRPGDRRGPRSGPGDRLALAHAGADVALGLRDPDRRRPGRPRSRGLAAQALPLQMDVRGRRPDRAGGARRSPRASGGWTSWSTTRASRRRTWPRTSGRRISTRPWPSISRARSSPARPPGG